ncbi:MAG: TVP38/TMEM64 family protein [Bacilli bacterium]
MMDNKLLKLAVKTFSIIITLLLITIIVITLKNTIFTSDDTLMKYLNGFGIYSSMAFIILQILQVIFPVIPGGASCLVGVILFGPLEGFIYNYVGLCIGSVIAFYLSKKYGLNLIRKLFPEKLLDKYLGYLNHPNFYKIFFMGILLPGAPDDFLCYLSGLTNISYKKFMIAIIVGKPLTLIGYSIGWYYFPSLLEFFR